MSTLYLVSNPDPNDDDLPEYLEVTPGVCGGKPCIAGTRIRVEDIVAYFRIGESAEEISMHYPQLTLASIYGAMAYYFKHQQTFDAQMKKALSVVEEARRLYPTKLPPK